MNAETKWTPGPWTVIPAVPYDGDEPEFEGAYTSPASIEGADGNPVCVFGSAEGSGSLFENEADYRLISAAPEMAEALRPFGNIDFSGTVWEGKGIADETPVFLNRAGQTITVGDFRRAAAALLKAGG